MKKTPKVSPWVGVTTEKFAHAVKNSLSVSGVLRYLGIPSSSGAKSNVKARVKAQRLSTSHWTFPLS